MGKTLYLREMGMGYINPATNGINNHRVRVLENIDIEYKGTAYNLFFEFRQCEKYNYRTTNKRTGQPLKHPVHELVNRNGLTLDTEYEQQESDSFGRVWTGSYRLGSFESEIWQASYDFTKDSVLEIVNKYSVEKYDKVVLVEEAARQIIERLGGYREKAILSDTWTYCTTTDTTWNEDHKVVRFVSRKKTKVGEGAYRYLDDVSCDVDIVTGLIVG